VSILFGLMEKLHYKLAYQPRLEALVSTFAPKLQTGDRVLDVGCGQGMLGAALAARVPGIHVEGIETYPRGGEPIRVTKYDGKAFPFDDNAFDVVIIADVLHHDTQPIEVLRECARVAGRLVIIKDHLRGGWWSQSRISLLDWLANAPHGVPCLYKYWSLAEWGVMQRSAGLETESQITSMRLYHWLLEPIFGGALHIVTFARPLGTKRPTPQ
jgi:ubiquinone/menaquinone biosynthesis C-methylase UbiE